MCTFLTACTCCFVHKKDDDNDDYRVIQKVSHFKIINDIKALQWNEIYFVECLAYFLWSTGKLLLLWILLLNYPWDGNSCETSLIAIFSLLQIFNYDFITHLFLPILQLRAHLLMTSQIRSFLCCALGLKLLIARRYATSWASRVPTPNRFSALYVSSPFLVLTTSKKVCLVVVTAKSTNVLLLTNFVVVFAFVFF